MDANTVFGFFPKRDVDCSLEKLMRLLDKYHVSKALTVSLKAAFYDYAEGNVDTLKACLRDSRLMPLASVDPRAYLGEPGELEELKRLGFKAVRLFPEFQGYPLDYAPLLRLFKNLEGLGFPLLVSDQGYGYMTRLARLTRSRDYPVIILGGSYSILSEFVALALENPHMYMETSLLDSPDAFELLVDKVSAERLVFGSNIPLSYFEASYVMVSRANIPEEAKQHIVCSNLERLLGGFQ